MSSDFRNSVDTEGGKGPGLRPVYLLPAVSVGPSLSEPHFSRSLSLHLVAPTIGD